MRLLNVHTLELKEFPSHHGAPAYLILSHTWEEEEVSFKDFSSSTVILPDDFNEEEPWLSESLPVISSPASSLKGYNKLMGWCAKARSEGFDWVWIDTCCIDKSSSAELSEAINSMFSWYSQAAVCYAYLADVMSGEDPSSTTSSFRKSRWFTRGWTLQEMLAPSDVVFLGVDWKEIGTRYELAEIVSEITGISRAVLEEPTRKAEYSLAQRMSWASTRSTTRIEDEAYCLLGLFGVNMPLLYGEGSNAFRRLQIEILERSDDISLLAWEHQEDDPCVPTRHNAGREMAGYTGVLADGVEAFRNSGKILSLPNNWPTGRRLKSPFQRSGIRVKATKQSVKLHCPIYGPIQTGRRLEGLHRALSSSESLAIRENSRQFLGSRERLGIPLNEYICPKMRASLTSWDGVLMIIVGMLDLWGSELYEEGSRLCIAILLSNKRTERLVSRLHWPPLLAVNFTRTHWQTFIDWPLTPIYATLDSSPYQERISEPILMTGPPEYSLVKEDDGAFCDNCVYFTYKPSARPFRYRGELPAAIEYADGPAGLPTFTIDFKWDLKPGIRNPTASVALTIGPSDAPFADSRRPAFDWIGLPYHLGTAFLLSEEKSVVIQRLKGPDMDIYRIRIEDVPPIPLPPPSTCWSAESAEVLNLLASLPPLPKPLYDRHKWSYF